LGKSYSTCEDPKQKPAHIFHVFARVAWGSGGNSLVVEGASSGDRLPYTVLLAFEP
jgi:hypothetical protein